jgi:class 3 adenylate cyclase
MNDDTNANSLEEWSAAIAAASARGDHLKAIDIASGAVVHFPEALKLQYQRLLAFTRAGAVRRAESELRRLRESGRIRDIADRQLSVDFAALQGRLLKERAIAASARADRMSLAAQAARAYERAFEQSGNCFPAINAATLWRIAEEADKSSALARAALESAALEVDLYWRRATEGEALILLGDDAAAIEALKGAALVGAGRSDAIASTRRQLAWLARTCGIGAGALAAMSAPRVIHWIADPRLANERPGDFPASSASGCSGLIAFGAILSLADLAVAEALNREGAELNLVLPCAADICGAFLGARGAGAPSRFDRLIASAGRVAVVTPEGDPGELELRDLALAQARGHALLRAGALATSAETALWRKAAVEFVATEPWDVGSLVAGWPDLGGGDPTWSRRRTRAIVFGDIRGFSALSESRHTAFFETVVGGFADALAMLGNRVEYAETAGDGIYLVLSDVVSATIACHALQRSVDPERLAAAGLSRDLGLRLSAHVGPVFHGLDRVTGREKFFGKEVVRTARIEPVTPPGETYVTEQFAAVLTCVAGARYECEYVGQQAMAKGFGECRMYSLRERDRSA